MTGRLVEPDAPGDWRRTPPLRCPDASQSRWLVGSALAGEPFLETLWFRADGRAFRRQGGCRTTRRGYWKPVRQVLVAAGAQGRARRARSSPCSTSRSACELAACYVALSMRSGCRRARRPRPRSAMSLLILES
jgi:hypothetical protein